MKKRIVLLLAVSFAASLAGCGYATHSTAYRKATKIFIKPFENKVDLNIDREYSDRNPYRLYRAGMETKITDAGVQDLTGLKQLTYLSLPPQAIRVQSLRTLRDANLVHTLSVARATEGRRPATAADVVSFPLGDITDAGLKEVIATFPNLNSLSIWHGNFTADGLKALAGLKNLKTLTLSAVEFTEKQAEDLRKALPNCTINRKL